MKKYLGLMVFIVTIFILFGCTINSYPDKVVYFTDKNAHIYAYNLKTQKKIVIAEGFGVKISHKKDRFMYSNIEMQQNGTLTASSGIYIYDINTKKSFSIFPLKPDDDPIVILNWSPDDRYIVLEGGETNNGFLVLDSITGKQIAHNEMHEEEFAWLNNDEIVFTETQRDIHQDEHMVGNPRGVTIMNVTLNQKHVFKEASKTVSYYYQELTPDNKIIFSSRKLVAVDDREWGVYQTTYWLMDDKGVVLKELPNYQPIEGNHQDALAENIKSKLPKPYDKYAEMYIRPLSGNWVILTGNNRNNYYEFFIMNKTNPNSLLKFGEGWSIDW